MKYFKNLPPADPMLCSYIKDPYGINKFPLGHGKSALNKNYYILQKASDDGMSVFSYSCRICRRPFIFQSKPGGRVDGVQVGTEEVKR